jgi:hypothetical protein
LRSLALGASTPWKRMRWTPGGEQGDEAADQLFGGEEEHLALAGAVGVAAVLVEGESFEGQWRHPRGR